MARPTLSLIPCLLLPSLLALSACSSVDQESGSSEIAVGSSSDDGKDRETDPMAMPPTPESDHSDSDGTDATEPDTAEGEQAVAERPETATDAPQGDDNQDGAHDEEQSSDTEADPAGQDGNSGGSDTDPEDMAPEPPEEDQPPAPLPKPLPPEELPEKPTPLPLSDCEGELETECEARLECESVRSLDKIFRGCAEAGRICTQAIICAESPNGVQAEFGGCRPPGWSSCAPVDKPAPPPEAEVDLSCTVDGDCRLCPYDRVPADTNDCGCAPLCVFKPMNAESCQMLSNTWSSPECRQAQQSCPIASCAFPSPAACIAGKCQSAGLGLEL